MAEVLGAIASGMTLASVFKSCLEAFELFQAARKTDLDLKKLIVRLNIERCRLYTWGEAMGLTLSKTSGHKSALETAPSQQLVREALEVVMQLLHDSEKIKARYGCKEQIPSDRSSDSQRYSASQYPASSHSSNSSPSVLEDRS
jgi:hypothetical protein